MKQQGNLNEENNSNKKLIPQEPEAKRSIDSNDKKDEQEKQVLKPILDVKEIEY